MCYPIKSTVISSPRFSPEADGRILSRADAQQRLKTLKSSSKEYAKLADALRKWGIVEIVLPKNSYKVNCTSKDSVLLGGFGSSEHVAIGKGVKLQGFEGDPPPLLIKHNVEVFFPDIIALAGDFYGVAGKAISLPGGSVEEKTERFVMAYETLALANSRELGKILLEIKGECESVEHSGLPHHCYSGQMMKKNSAIEGIKSDIRDLLYDNSDHFHDNAREAYLIGHKYALTKAAEAGPNNLDGLKEAYALDAFACHFLTDLFAAGHIRNQRGPLEKFLVSQLKFDPRHAKPLAGILTGAQHEQDGNAGLNITDGSGDKWRAYGDGCFFTPKNERNKEKAIAAVQRSVDEVYAAYNKSCTLGGLDVEKLLPTTTDLNPLSIYSVCEDSLVLHANGKDIKVENQLDYLTHGLSQALRYLPQEFIDGYLSQFEINSPLVNKVIFPAIERLTGGIWRIVGIATSYQLSQINQELNSKTDEMADVLKEIYHGVSSISKAIDKLDRKVDQLLMNVEMNEIATSLKNIKDVCFAHGNLPIMFFQNSDNSKTELWKSIKTLGRVFGSNDGKRIFSIYKKGSMETYENNEVLSKIAVTLWYRQMLDYQVRAFQLYIILKVAENPEGIDPQRTISEFELSLSTQIVNNDEFILSDLICESTDYIQLQLEKSTVNQLALKIL